VVKNTDPDRAYLRASVSVLLAGDKSGEREQNCVTRKCWDVRSLSVAGCLLALIALCLFAFGCVEITVSFPADAQAQTETEPSAAANAGPQSFEVHAL
jgi:hypothetical protein